MRGLSCARPGHILRLNTQSMEGNVTFKEGTQLATTNDILAGRKKRKVTKMLDTLSKTNAKGGRMPRRVRAGVALRRRVREVFLMAPTRQFTESTTLFNTSQSLPTPQALSPTGLHHTSLKQVTPRTGHSAVHVWRKRRARWDRTVTTQLDDT